MKSSVNFVSLDFNYTRFFENIITKKLQETRKKVALGGLGIKYFSTFHHA